MLNYVWALLLVAAFVFALQNDVRDLRNDSFGNGKPLAVTVTPKSVPADARSIPVDVAISPDAFGARFKVDAPTAVAASGTLVRLEQGYQLKFADGVTLPPRLVAMRDFTDDKVLQGQIKTLAGEPVAGQAISAEVSLPPVRFVKLRAISQAAFDMSKNAVVQITFGLIGALALWLGIMKIAEACGLVEAMVRLIQPILRPLFPDIPKDHPAMGYIAVNIAGNILGLGNATTAMGLKAMESLQTLNPSKDTASNSMVMLLAVHTAAFQLVPPATLIALMGFAAMDVFLPMLCVGVLGTIIAIASVKLLGRLPAYRRSDPGTLTDLQIRHPEGA